tara:strand:+ start:644 stop:874 length:231 start_codon:yes stop_codon:yes gene_type:complete
MTKLINDIEIERLQRKTYKRNQRRYSNRLMKAYSAKIEQEKKNANKFLYGKEEGAKKLKQKGFSMGGMADYIKELL